MQRGDQPVILTGYSALNKLLGREVYTSHMQLGGPKVSLLLLCCCGVIILQPRALFAGEDAQPSTHGSCPAVRAAWSSVHTCRAQCDLVPASLQAATERLARFQQGVDQAG